MRRHKDTLYAKSCAVCEHFCKGTRSSFNAPVSWLFLGYSQVMSLDNSMAKAQTSRVTLVMMHAAATTAELLLHKI